MEEYSAAQLSFPMARVKKIVKTDSTVGTIQNDALLFIAAAAVPTNTVANDERLHFLMELIPKPVSLVEAMEYQRKRRAEGGEVAGGELDAEPVEGEGDEPQDDEMMPETMTMDGPSEELVNVEGASSQDEDNVMMHEDE